jgi:hypothetical protein
MRTSHRPESESARVRYIWGAALIWAMIWIATAVVLKDRGGFAEMIPILTIGTGWFIAVVPAQLARPDHDDSRPEEADGPRGSSVDS